MRTSIFIAAMVVGSLVMATEASAQMSHAQHAFAFGRPYNDQLDVRGYMWNRRIYSGTDLYMGPMYGIPSRMDVHAMPRGYAPRPTNTGRVGSRRMHSLYIRGK